MIAAALLLVAQSAPIAGPAPTSASAPAPVPERFSVLARNCPPARDDKDVVVCADGTTGLRLPLPDERQPDGPAPSNPKMDGAGALAAGATPCAATQKGCTVGIGPPPQVVAAALGAISDAFAKKPDKRGRVAIDLDAPAPDTVGHVLP